MTKVIFVVYRRQDLSHSKCMEEWKGITHTSIVKKLNGLTKWVQNQVEAAEYIGIPDGIGELWFKDHEIREKAMNSVEMAAAVEDAKRFLDMEKSYALMVNEKTIKG